MDTTIQLCEKCRGMGEVPSGHLGPWGPAYRVCPVCDGLGAVEVEPEPEPPAPAGRLVVGGFEVTAPAFTSPAQFDRAIGRAFMDDLTIAPTDRGDTVTVTNPTSGRSYTVTRSSCTCPAGARGTACKHIAFAVMVADVWHALPTPVTVPAAA